jgi:L-asparagine transporter-like permease
MGDDPMALLGLEGALKHYYYYYYVMLFCHWQVKAVETHEQSGLGTGCKKAIHDSVVFLFYFYFIFVVLYFNLYVLKLYLYFFVFIIIICLLCCCCCCSGVGEAHQLL